MIPEFTPSPAIGWIVCAASPTNAILYFVYKLDCIVESGNESRLFNISVISGIVS